jgi:hypothetical protein
MRKLERYIDELLTQQIGPDDVEDENISLFIRFIKGIYRDSSVAIFPFPFLERVDDFISSPNNMDMIRKMFDIIQKQEGTVNIISSGGFGLWIYQLVDEGEIEFDGNIVVVSGQIRKVKEDQDNRVEIIRKRYEMIDEDFIFLDDSYFSGGTRDKINDFLKKYDSRIYRTFVFYTHNPENPKRVYSVYCYSENHIEEVIPIHKYSEYVKDVNLEEYADDIWDKIYKDEFSGVKELLRYIKSLNDTKLQEGIVIKYKNFIK